MTDLTLIAIVAVALYAGYLAGLRRRRQLEADRRLELVNAFTDRLGVWPRRTLRALDLYVRTGEVPPAPNAEEGDA